MAAETDGNEQRPGPRPVKNRKEHLRHLEERESALTAELEAARAEGSLLVDEVERHRQGLATGESSVADVGKARRRAEEHWSSVQDLEAALVGISDQRQSLASEIDQEKQERERARQDVAGAPLRAEADELVKEFIDGLVGLCDPLRKRKQLAEEFSFKFPLVKGVPSLTVEALARALQSALDLQNGADGTTTARSLVLRALAGPEDLPILRVPIPLDRLRELGISEG